jgi:regulator of replication initiation timing
LTLISPIYEIPIVFVIVLVIENEAPRSKLQGVQAKANKWAKHASPLSIEEDNEYDHECGNNNLFSVSCNATYASLVGVHQDTVFCHEFRNKAIFIGKCPTEGG